MLWLLVDVVLAGAVQDFIVLFVSTRCDGKSLGQLVRMEMGPAPLLLCTTVLVKMKREKYVWVTLVPTAWLLVTTLTAGVQKIFDPDPKIGFVALAQKFSAAAEQGKVLAPAKSIAEMQRVAFNNYVDAWVCGLFVLLVLAMCFFALVTCLKALREARPTTHEIPSGFAPAGGGE